MLSTVHLEHTRSTSIAPCSAVQVQRSSFECSVSQHGIGTHSNEIRNGVTK